MANDTAEATVQTQVWENDETTGYLKLVRTKTVSEVYEEIVALLPKDEYGYITKPGIEEYFTLMASALDATQRWPEGRVCVFPVTGSSEGHYVHVEVLSGGSDDSKHTLLMLGKTFLGWDAAWDAAKALATMLEV